ncbi:MAG: helix-turn-helix transcriptional regulator [Candidatus Lokiarchaeota archaeon]|nr:helix-turn-helix transcriptional regulator [Candidatus Lokiarchaeota archaeon]
MNQSESFELEHKGFIILGLLAEEPSGTHAYSLNKKIEERGMRNWTEIGKSSIYRIASELEEIGLVASYEEEFDNRVRKMYKITDYGYNILKDKVYEVLRTFNGRNDPDFYVAFSMLPFLTKEEIEEAIQNSIEAINLNLEELRELLEQNSHLGLNVRGLFVHPIKILETDLEFLKEVLREVKEGGGIKLES